MTEKINTPWALSAPIHIVDNKGQTVAITYHSENYDGNSRVNANFIITAVNSYASLIELLKRVQQLSEEQVGHDLLADIDEVLEKAGA